MRRRWDPIHLVDFSFEVSSEVLVTEYDVVRLLLFVGLKVLHIGIDFECLSVVCDCGLRRSHLIFCIERRGSPVFVIELVLVVRLPIHSASAFIWFLSLRLDRVDLTTLSRWTLVNLECFK